MIRKSAAIATLLLGLGGTAHALEFQPLGAGSLGVGGAGVARTYGAMAPYWNPAGLAFAPKTVTVSITGGVGVSPRGKLAQDLDDLDTSYNAWNADQANLDKANALANAVNGVIGTTHSDNLRVTAGAAVGAQMKHLGIGAYGTFEGAAIPNPGGTPIPTPLSAATLDQATVDAALNSKTVTVRGLLLVEVPISYGYAIDLGHAGKLGVGASAKYMRGEATSKQDQQVFDTVTKKAVSSSDLTHDLWKNRRDSSAFGIDLGLLWKPTNSTGIGLVAKNLNAPSFDAANGDKIRVDPQVRAGGNIDLFSWLAITGDIDVIPNTTVVSGLKTQHLGGGAEFHPFSSLRLRVGGYTDLASSTSGAVTAGLSLGIPSFYFDIDGAYGLGTVRYQNDRYPTEAKVQFSTNIAF